MAIDRHVQSFYERENDWQHNQEIVQHLIAEGYLYGHVWQPGDMLFVNDSALYHGKEKSSRPESEGVMLYRGNFYFDDVDDNRLLFEQFQ